MNGAFVFVPPTLETLADEEESVDLPALVATLRSIYPLRYVIVTRELLPPAQRAAWERIDRDPRHGVTFVGRFAHDDFAHDDLFSLAGTPQQGVLLRRWFSADFVRRYPLAVYAVSLTDAERAVRRRTEVRFNGRLVATHETPVQAVVSLESPYRTGDRNELTFTHSYDLDPATTSEPAYRVGRTAAQSPVDIRAVSAANPHGNRASILVNGRELVEGKPRGYVVAALDGRSGKPVGAASSR